MAFQKEIFFFQTASSTVPCSIIHWTNSFLSFFSFFFLVFLFHPSPSSLLWKCKSLGKDTEFLYAVYIVNFIVFCLFSFYSEVVAFWSIFSPFQFRYSLHTVRDLNLKHTDQYMYSCNHYPDQDREYFLYLGKVLFYL